jgi:hypothetical protein
MSELSQIVNSSWGRILFYFTFIFLRQVNFSWTRKPVLKLRKNRVQNIVLQKNRFTLLTNSEFYIVEFLTYAIQHLVHISDTC